MVVLLDTTWVNRTTHWLLKLKKTVKKIESGIMNWNWASWLREESQSLTLIKSFLLISLLHNATIIVHIPHNCRLASTWMTLFPWKQVRHKAGNGSMKGEMDGGSSRRGIMRSWRRITLWARKSLKLWFVEICTLLTFKPWNSVRRGFQTGREKSRETWRQVPVKESLDSRRGSGSSD